MSQPHPPVARRLARAAALAAVPLAFGACDWFTVFKEQPSIEPYESYGFANYGRDSLATDTIPFRGQPQGSVAVTGNALPVWQVSYRPLPGVIDSIAAITQNPVPLTQASVANGRLYYSINCAVCHGDDGQGQGRATLYGMPGISLMNDRVRGFGDGYIYGMIRNGRGLMPRYNRIPEQARWDVVNYIRAMQGLAPGITAELGAAGYPGQTGEYVPRYSEYAPTRPAPFTAPSTWLRADVSPVPAGEQPMPGATVPAGTPPVPSSERFVPPAPGAQPAPTVQPPGTGGNP